MRKMISKEDLRAVYGDATSAFNAKLDLALTRLENGEEMKVKKKLSLTTVIALAAVMIFCVALATAPKPMPTVADNSDKTDEFMAVTDSVFVLDDLQEGAKLTINEACYDDEYLYIENSLEGIEVKYDYAFEVSAEEAASMQKVRSDAYLWLDCSEKGLEEVEERLKRDGRAAIKVEDIDFMYKNVMPDGTPVDGSQSMVEMKENLYVFNLGAEETYSGGEKDRKSGTSKNSNKIGIPEAVAEKEMIYVQQTLARITEICYFEGSDLENCTTYWAISYEPLRDVVYEAEKTAITFTIFGLGRATYGHYTAEVTLCLSPVNIRADIVLLGLPVRTINKVNEPEQVEYVATYDLYVEDRPYYRYGRRDTETGLSIDYWWDGSFGEFKLVPVYTQSGSNFNEQITFSIDSITKVE